MGNRITRISRRTFFKNKKKKSKKNNSGPIINEQECQCNSVPATAKTQTCMSCMAGYMQEIELNRLNGKRPIYSGHWRIIEYTTIPSCGAQFDAKKFDKIFKLNRKHSQRIDESENDDSQFENSLSDSFQQSEISETYKKQLESKKGAEDLDSFQSKTLEINKKRLEDNQTDSFQSENSEISKKRPDSMQDDDNNSFISIFEVFEKLEHKALLSSTALDEMFFYPAIAEGSDCCTLIECTKPKFLQTQLSIKNESSTLTNDEKKLFDETQHFDDSLFDETAHLYDTVASSDEFEFITCNGSKNTSSLRAKQLKSFKPDDIKFRNKKYKCRKSKKIFHTQHKPIPFNATQFDTKQIDNTEFDGLLFNDSQFDAKLFNATQIDVTPFFVNQLEESQVSASKADLTLQLSETRPFKESQFHALKFTATPHFKKSNGSKLHDDSLGVTEKQSSEANFISRALNAEKSDMTEFEAALIRTAQYVASHFGPEGLNDKKQGAKDFIAAPFRTTQFNASQFNAKQFDVSQFSANFSTANFTASQFDAKAFDAQNCNILQSNSSEASRFYRSQLLHGNYFKASQFDAQLFNVTNFDSRRVYAT